MGDLLKVARIGFLAWRCTHRAHSFHSTLVEKKNGYFWPQNKSRLSNSMYTVKSCFNYMFSGAQQFLRSMRKFQKEYLHLHFVLRSIVTGIKKRNDSLSASTTPKIII